MSLSFLVCGVGIIIVPVSQSCVSVKQDNVYKKAKRVSWHVVGTQEIAAMIRIWGWT